MPTNRAVDWRRTPRGLKWAITVAVVVTPAYLGLAALCIRLAAHSGIGWLNVLVLTFFCNAMKLAWMALLSPMFLFKGIADGKHGGGCALVQ
jgi:hypothetical protein